MTTLIPVQAITIEIRSVYGQLKAYPVCQKAKLFAQLAGHTTLTHGDLCLIERLGYEIVSMSNADYRRVA